MRVILYWQKAYWMSKPEVSKELKRYYSTCLSFGADLTVIDGDGSVKETGRGFGFDVIDSLDELDLSETYALFEPEASNQNSMSLEVYDHSDENYVIWTEYGTIPFAEFPNSTNVHICTSDERPLWSLTAMSIILYNRMLKNDSSV